MYGSPGPHSSVCSTRRTTGLYFCASAPSSPVAAPARATTSAAAKARASTARDFTRSGTWANSTRARESRQAATASLLPHRQKYLLVVISFLRPFLDLHLEWVDEV